MGGSIANFGEDANSGFVSYNNKYGVGILVNESVKTTVEFAKGVWYTLTGEYKGTEGNDMIYAYGLGGVIYSYGGHDTVSMGGFYTKIIDTWGHLHVYGVSAALNIYKSSNFYKSKCTKSKHF